MYIMTSEICNRTTGPPSDLLVGPLRPVGPWVLQSLQHQQVAVPVAEHKLWVGGQRGEAIQQAFHGLLEQGQGSDNVATGATREDDGLKQAVEGSHLGVGGGCQDGLKLALHVMDHLVIDGRDLI